MIDSPPSKKRINSLPNAFAAIDTARVAVKVLFAALRCFYPRQIPFRNVGVERSNVLSLDFIAVAAWDAVGSEQAKCVLEQGRVPVFDRPILSRVMCFIR